jgi:hypothetical protein
MNQSTERTRNRRRTGLRIAAAGTVIAALAVSGVAVASAASDDRSPADRTRAAKAVSARVSGAVGGGGCAVGFDTATATNTPPDDSTSDNVPANTVALKKRCTGPVIGSFVSETSTPNAGDFIHLDARATCVSKAGLRNACTVGQQVLAAPGHTFFATGPDTFGTHSYQPVWTGLKRGLWRFQILPGGNASANLQFRSFVVSAY